MGQKLKLIQALREIRQLGFGIQLPVQFKSVGVDRMKERSRSVERRREESWDEVCFGFGQVDRVVG